MFFEQNGDEAPRAGRVNRGKNTVVSATRGTYTSEMRMMLFSLALLTAAVAPAAAPDLTGKWDVALSVAGNDSQQACTFTQKAAELTGTCGSEGRSLQITGKVEDQKVTWTFKSEYQGNPLTVVFRGSIESATKITGSVLVEEFGVEGQFTATQSK